MKKPLYVYEVGVPVREIWVMQVVAENRKEALSKAQRGEGDQMCSISGRKGYVRRLRKQDKDV